MSLRTQERECAELRFVSDPRITSTTQIHYSSILEEKEVIEIPGNKETQYPEKTMTLPSRELTPKPATAMHF